MKHAIAVSLLVILSTGCLTAQVINTFMGTTPTIDGTIGAGEWSDAHMITFTNDQGTITVYMKHDGNALYFAADIVDSAYYWGDDIVISLDPNHDAGLHPQTDDIELYIRRDNSTSVVFEGSGLEWITMLDVTGLDYATSSSAGKWQAECSVSYARLGITAGTAKTVGVEFRNYDDASGWFNYPASGAERIPDTWADLSITFTTSIGESTSPETELRVYPNPATSTISIDAPQPADVEIVTMLGQRLQYLAPGVNAKNIDVSRLPAGLYVIKVTTNRGCSTRTLIKR